MRSPWRMMLLTSDLRRSDAMRCFMPPSGRSLEMSAGRLIGKSRVPRSALRRSRSSQRAAQPWQT
eukprot:14748423-Alexandrium_andersonii.AAC.1